MSRACDCRGTASPRPTDSSMRSSSSSAPASRFCSEVAKRREARERGAALTCGLDTLFLDAGGVLVHPSWTRISAALARHDVDIGPAALARAEPYAKRELDVAHQIQQTTDATRVPRY